MEPSTELTTYDESRKRKRADSTASEYADIAYPVGPPKSPFEQGLHCLNLEAFPYDQYARIDDLLLYALFGSKRKAGKGYREVNPTPVHARTCGPDEASAIGDLCRALMDKPSCDYHVAQSIAKDLIETFPQRFCEDDGEMIRHLLLRYALLYSESSMVRIEKVLFDGKVSFGLRASKAILANTCLLTTASSMSSNPGPTGLSRSLIRSTPEQLGSQSMRLILGPFQLGNHDCNPNCRIAPIANTHAFVWVTLRDIEAGESLTARLTGDKYAEKDCPCATCDPTRSSAAPRRPVDAAIFAPNDRLRKHRGGRREKRRIRSAAIKASRIAEGAVAGPSGQ